MPEHAAPERLNSIIETGKRLSVHEQTVRELIRAGELGAVRVGKRLLVSDQQIAEFIKSHTIKAS